MKHILLLASLLLLACTPKEHPPLIQDESSDCYIKPAAPAPVPVPPDQQTWEPRKREAVKPPFALPQFEDIP